MFLNHSELCFADILFVICMLWKYLFLKFGFNLNCFGQIIKIFMRLFFKNMVNIECLCEVFTVE